MQYCANWYSYGGWEKDFITVNEKQSIWKMAQKLEKSNKCSKIEKRLMKKIVNITHKLIENCSKSRKIDNILSILNNFLIFVPFSLKIYCTKMQSACNQITMWRIRAYYENWRIDTNQNEKVKNCL